MLNKNLKMLDGISAESKSIDALTLTPRGVLALKVLMSMLKWLEIIWNYVCLVSKPQWIEEQVW